MPRYFPPLIPTFFLPHFPQVWRQYWDFQLYKALEYQYIQGLECINKTLPEQEIKMVFRQHKLQVGG